LGSSSIFATRASGNRFGLGERLNARIRDQENELIRARAATRESERDGCKEDTAFWNAIAAQRADPQETLVLQAFLAFSVPALPSPSRHDE
jgi:hypothetical protein